MVGIKWYVIWITWLIRILMPYMILSLIISLIAIINMQPRIKDNPSLTTKAIFKSTNFMVGFSVLFIYSIQTAFLILLFGQIFSKSIFIFWLFFFFYFNIFLNNFYSYFIFITSTTNTRIDYFLTNDFLQQWMMSIF